MTVTRELTSYESSRCSVFGCVNPTSEGKPYCIDHLDLLPYVTTIKAELARRDEQDAAAMSGKGRVLDPNGSRPEEILIELSLKGALSVERLALTLQLPLRATESYVRTLERAGKVVMLRLGSRRGAFRRIVVPTNGSAKGIKLPKGQLDVVEMPAHDRMFPSEEASAS